MEVLKWLRQNGCPWNESACFNAAERGQLEVLKWLRQNGCPWGDKEHCFNIAKNFGHELTAEWIKNSKGLR